MGLNLKSVVILVTVIISAVKARVAVPEVPDKPNCPIEGRCGDVTIPYPFSTSVDCSISIGFYIYCNTTFDPPKPFIGDVEVLNISLQGDLRILMTAAYDCYSISGRRSYERRSLRRALFPISEAKNKFTAIECDTGGFLQGSVGRGVSGLKNYTTGCISICNKPNEVINGSCQSLGCCEISIPKRLWKWNYYINLTSYYNHSKVLDKNPCSYAFVAENGNYTFSSSDLGGYDFLKRKFPVILDWKVRNINCSEAEKNKKNFACKGESKCVDSDSTGYLCQCSKGFQGNPYLSGGCQGTIIGFLGLSLGILLLYLIVKRRQISKLRETHFQQNGGNLLREQLSKHQGCGENVKVFVAEELEKATNNYHESRILGQGGQGTVYKGILADNRVVAIKKSKIGDQSQVEPFINEIIVLCQINHRNVVKLLGCCLETPVPLLVYEYVNNGTLFEHIHNVDPAYVLSWEDRLRIATETGESISYLHSAASVPIIHRDIKLANILLDEHYTAKVSDFGASRFIPSDQAEITTIVQGTFGYLDPEYMHTSLLTEKSDVYSFGVVLIELLTGQKVVSFERPEENRVLAMYFVSLMKEDRLQEILDPRLLKNGIADQQLKEVAAIAWRCVRVKGEERPTMKEVARELAGLQAKTIHPLSMTNLQGEESEYFLGELCSTNGDGATSSSMGFDSINNNKITFELKGAR